MSGTEWAEPGQGATVAEISYAIRFDPDLAARENLNRLVNLGGDPDAHMAWTSEQACYRTNLRLTGQTLTAEDVQRIAEAK